MKESAMITTNGGMLAKAWPFQEARKILERIAKKPKEMVVFATGYGPSGLPHIGTFAEVLRTTMVRRAFQQISDIPTRLIAFSDDLDGLRKVPENIPNPEKMQEFLGKPLTSVPDPFGKYSSFAAHNNAKLREFLDRFGFDYEFMSASEQYQSGNFDVGLKKILENYEQVLAVMLKSLGAERQQTYSPFLPICAESGVVLQSKVVEIDAIKGMISYENILRVRSYRLKLLVANVSYNGNQIGRCVGMCLGLDYEMAGKDLFESVKLSAQIIRILGGSAPEGISYELFLDEKW